MLAPDKTAKWATLGIVGVAGAGLLAKTVQGIVSFVPNLLPSRTPKEGVRGVQVSASFQPAAAFVVVVVGIGLLASLFLVRADHDGSVNVPQVNCLWVENHGSIGFDVKFDVSNHPDSDNLSSGFQLKQSGVGIVDRELWVKSATLLSKYCGWLSIPGYDGGPPLPYPDYTHSFDFVVEGLEFEGLFPYGAPRVDVVHSVASSVSVQLYVELNSNGSLRSMSAWAVDSDGGSYEVPVYYSPGGSENFRTFED